MPSVNPGPNVQTSTHPTAIMGNMSAAGTITSFTAPNGSMLTAFPQGQNLTTVYLGDSVAVQQGTPPQQTGNSMFFWGNCIAGGLWEVLANYGVNGITSGQMLAGNQIQQAIALSPTAVELWIGQNDFGGGVGASTTIANLTSIYQQLIAAGIYVRAYSILPRNDLTQKSFFGNLLQVNTWMREYWRNNPNGEYLDVFSQMINPTSTTLTTLAQNTADGVVHPGFQGGFLIGQNIIAPALTRWGANALQLPGSAMEDTAQQTTGACLSQNPLMLGTGGTAGTATSGTIPTGAFVGGSAQVTCVCTNPARSDGFGNNLQVAMTATASGIATIQLPYTNTTPSNYVSGRNIYQVYQMTIAANPTSLSGIQGLTVGPFGLNPTVFLTTTGNNLSTSSPVNMIVRFPVTQTVGSYQNTYTNLTISFSAAGSATISVGRQAIYQRPF